MSRFKEISCQWQNSHFVVDYLKKMQQLSNDTADVSCSLMIPSDSTIIIFCAILSLIAVMASFGNILTILVIAVNPLKRLRTPFIFFLLNLSVADTLQGSVSIPLVIHSLSTHIQIKSLYVKSSPITDVLTLISVATVFFATMFIALDRCIAITRPIKYRTSLSWQRCLKISIFMWLLSVALALIILVYVYRSPYRTDMILANNYFMFVVGTMIMLIVFFRAYRFLKKHQEKYCAKLRSASITSVDQRYNTEKRVTKVLLMVLGVFVATYAPALVMLNITRFCLQCSCHIKFNLYISQYIFLVSNSAVNPFIYTIRIKDFRDSLKSMFQRTSKKLDRKSNIDIKLERFTAR